MTFLVDTNILSEPAKPQPNLRVEKRITGEAGDKHAS